jgi:hypothetical protein
VTIPATIRPSEVDLAVTAILLRDGLHGQAVPSYDAALVGRVVAQAARKATVARGRA